MIEEKRGRVYAGKHHDQLKELEEKVDHLADQLYEVEAREG